jgi:hypothetical protein
LRWGLTQTVKGGDKEGTSELFRGDRRDISEPPARDSRFLPRAAKGEIRKRGNLWSSQGEIKERG